MVADWLVRWLAGWPAGWLAGWLRGRRFTCKQKARARLLTRVSGVPRIGWLVGWLAGLQRNPKMIVSRNCMDSGTKTYPFGRFSGPSYKGAHTGWLVGVAVLCDFGPLGFIVLCWLAGWRLAGRLAGWLWLGRIGWLAGCGWLAG